MEVKKMIMDFNKVALELISETNLIASNENSIMNKVKTPQNSLETTNINEPVLRLSATMLNKMKCCQNRPGNL